MIENISKSCGEKSCAATRALVKLVNGKANTYPHASITLNEDFYMDNFVSGAESLEQALISSNELPMIRLL